MQLTLPLLSPQSPAHRTLMVGGRTYQVKIARHRLARRYLLRVSDDGRLRLTVPRGASIADGLAFATAQREWIERERLRVGRRTAPWRDGALVLFRGVQEPLRVGQHAITCGTETIRLPSGAADAAADFRELIETHFRRLAAHELPARCFDLASRHGLRVDRVLVRNQKSRWGACSPRRVITLNWRLLQMPPSVCEYVLLHELMHLKHANHSRRFWRAVEEVCPTWRDSERWLRKYGREIL